MKRYPFLSAFAITLASVSYASAATILTAADYCSPDLTSPAGIKEMIPMADGVSFAAKSDDGKSIEVYSYKTGEKISTLFSIDGVKGDIHINGFDGYQISENGKKILLWNEKDKLYRNSFYAEYYVYDIMRSTLKRVSTGGKQRGAVLSHDGRMVAYTRGNNIFISNLDYDTDKPITTDGENNRIINGSPDWSYEEEFGVLGTIRWSGDDTTLAYIRFDESEVPEYQFDVYRSYCDSDPLSDLYPGSYSYKYPLSGYPNSKVTVHAYNIDTRVTKTMDLEIGSDYIPSMEFDGEGKNLMVMVLNRDQNDLKLYKVNPASTVCHLILSEKSEAWLSPQAYQMVEYGNQSFVIGSERTGYRHLYEYDYNGNLIKLVSSGNWNVTAYYGLDKASGNHYIQCTALGAINRNIAVIDKKGNFRILNNTEGTEDASFSKNMDYYVRSYSNALVPPRYSICNNNGKEIKILEQNEEYASRYASAPRKEFIKLKNSEGLDMNAYIIKPLNFDATKKYPLLMYQYNGPDSQEVLNKWKMEGIYYIASQGYIVACIDGRGTGNRDREWSTSVYRHLGLLETADQIAGTRKLAEYPYIDSSRMACFGWSYGGYMTLMELSDKNNPFKAGIAMAPVTDWHFYDSIYTERYMSTPGANSEGYRLSSALGRSEMMNSRLLIMSGTSDDNVHFYNTLKYTSKLNSEGKLFDMMAFAGFEHSLRMCNAREQLFKKILDYLNNHLK